MLTKEQLEKILADQEVLTKKVEEAEVKCKKLEEENIKMTSNIVGSSSNSDESRLMKFFGVSHPKELLKLNVGHSRFSNVPDELKYLAIDFKKSMDIARMTAQMFHGAPLDSDAKRDDQDPVRVKNVLETYYGKNILAPKIKAFGSTVSTGGDEWVPTGISSSYIEEYTLEKVLEQRLKVVNMPTNPFDMPVIAAGTTARKATEGVIGTAANFSTAKLSLSAVKLYQYSELPEELAEDSAPDFLAAAREDVILAQKKAVETAIINGDSDGTHIDSDTQSGGADLAEKIWDGWRKLALANSGNGATYDFLNAIVDDTKLGVMRTRMGKFGVNPRELAWVVSPTVYAQMTKLSNLIGIDKMGPATPLLTGTLGFYFGAPVLISEHFREDLNATGVYDGTTDTRMGIILTNLTRWYIGNRRPIQVKVMMDLPYHDRWLLASYRRVAFKGFTQSATEKSIVYGYNIAK